MNATLEKTNFRVISDLLQDEGNELFDKILNDNIQDRDAIKNLEANKHVPPNSTYSSLYNKIERYIDLPNYKKNPYKPPASFEVIQEWEGYVQEIDENERIFTAILLDITANKAYPSEEADFKIDDVDRFDLHFLRIGAVFRWVIGYDLKRVISQNGSVSVTKISSSNFVFRRMSRWSDASLKQADKKAKEFKDEIIWE